MQREDAERVIMQFLSALSWIENGGVLVEHFTGGPHPNPTGRHQNFGFSIQEDFDLSYLPEPPDEKAQLALALMREGRGLNHPAYAFLSFYRVLEVALGGTGKTRSKWITAQIDQIHDPHAKEVMAKLTTQGIDIGQHLYESGRCAIAHASSKPIINPDDPAEARRLSAELPIMRALAVLAIEAELGVETMSTVWGKHLYELDGFKAILGREMAASIARGEPMHDTHPTIEFPPISIELRKRAPYKFLTNLQPISLTQVGAVVVLVTRSANGCFGFRCHLDFAQERLHFDFQHDLWQKDDGTAECAELHVDVNRFIYDYLCNGQLRLLNSTTNGLLSRKDAFLPVNCMVNDDVCRAEIDRWVTIARERRERTKAADAENVGT